MWPVILRELRAGSRRWTTYWLRLLGAGVVVLAIGYWLSQPESMFARQPGREVFLQLHRIILLAIWIVVPLMTADCLSREKCEGTLGLLFLTNLSAREIVFAKAAAAGLVGLTLWLAVVPIMTVPLLLGGLPAWEILYSCALALGSLCGALAAALLASAMSRNVSDATILALAFAGLGYFGFCLLVGLVHYGVLMGLSGLEHPLRAFVFGWFTVGSIHASVAFFAPTVGRPVALHWIVLLIPTLSFLLSLVVAFLAARFLRRNWQDKPKSRAQTETEKFFCSPVFLSGTFRSWMRRSLEGNPIGWLEKRRVSGRIMAWIWLAIMISCTTTLAYGGAGMRTREFNPLMWLLLITIAYNAAGSFRRERETGALELILVTPMSERQIIHGRLRGLWSQFLPTFALWAAVVIYLSTGVQRWDPADLIQFTVAYFIVPVVGLYFSLRSRFVLLAWLTTLAACFVAPQLSWRMVYVLSDAIMGYPAFRPILSNQLLIILPVQLGLAAFLFWRLHVNLARRTFSFR